MSGAPNVFPGRANRWCVGFCTLAITETVARSNVNEISALTRNPHGSVTVLVAYVLQLCARDAHGRCQESGQLKQSYVLLR